MSSSRPHVVHLPGNDVLVDARVLKYIATTAALGLRTTGLGVVHTGRTRRYRMGGAEIVVAASAPKGTNRDGQVSTAPALRQIVRPTAESPTMLAALAEEQRARASSFRAALTTTTPSVGRYLRALARLLSYARVLVLRRGLQMQSRVRSVQEDDAQTRMERLSRLLEESRRIDWRSTLPTLSADGHVLSGILEDLDPDVIHVHDVFMLGVASRHVRRAAQSGRGVKVIYDAHEYVPGLATVPIDIIAAYCALEREFMPEVDRVVTVSPLLARWLQRDYGMERAPTVVVNAPLTALQSNRENIRDAIGLPSEVPLLVYAGGINQARGVQDAVAALGLLPAAHLAIVTNRAGSSAAQEFKKQAASLGAAHRLHILNYVPPEHVVPYLSTATLGLSTLHRTPNHDAALTNKFCEYLMAGIPIVTSDTTAQAEAVRDLEIGTVYTAGDPEDLARAVDAALAQRDQLAARLNNNTQIRRDFSWPGQVATVAALYEEVLGTWKAGQLDAASVQLTPPHEVSG